MDNYNLAPNEGIIIQHDGVYHNDKRSELILTNQNLICVETNIKLFKNTYNTIKIPLNQIKVVNGQAQASVIKESPYLILQILLKDRIEKFKFSYDFLSGIKKKQELNMWVEQISLLLTGKSAANITDASLIGEVKNVLGTIGINAKPKKAKNVTAKCIGCMAPLSGPKGQNIRCKYCDTNQTL